MPMARIINSVRQPQQQQAIIHGVALFLAGAAGGGVTGAGAGGIGVGAGAGAETVLFFLDFVLGDIIPPKSQ